MEASNIKRLMLANHEQISSKLEASRDIVCEEISPKTFESMRDRCHVRLIIYLRVTQK